MWLNLPGWLRFSIKGLVALTLLLLFIVAIGWWYFHPTFERTDGVVYGERHGKPLTMDVMQPAEPNGRAVAFVVSGGWRSQKPGEAPSWMVAPLMRRGYTVFAICHISQPESTVMEIIEDMNRGIRYVRHHADDFGIEPDKIGVSGGSAGGHLSLMLATRGGPGPEDADDPIDRESSAVQAVAIFFPVTDLVDMGDSTDNPGDGGPPITHASAFGPGAQDMDTWKQIAQDCSPIFHIAEHFPPTLIHHGDADTLTPLDQSERFRDAAKEHGHDVKVVVHPGGGHGWLTMPWDIMSFADWFDEHLGRD